MEFADSLINAQILPWCQGDNTCIFPKHSLLNLTYKLRQLRVCATTKVYLKKKKKNLSEKNK